MRIAASAAVLFTLAGCARYKHDVAPSRVDSAPEPRVHVLDGRDQRSIADNTRQSPYDGLLQRLQQELGSNSPRIVLLWDAELPENDGGWQGQDRLSLYSNGAVNDKRASLAAHLSHEAFARPRLEGVTPSHRNATEANVTGILLQAGLKLSDLKVANLRAQPSVGQDEVYHQVKALLDNAVVSLEVFNSGNATAVRVRDLETASLLAYAHITHDSVYSRTTPRRIFGNERPTLAEDPAATATFAAVGSTLLDGLRRRR